MGKIKDLMVQIQDMALNGYDAEDIALILDVPQSWVYEVVGMADDSDYDYDGQPDEAQEWHDFDPAC
jgi:hypothetical protein